MLDHGTLICAYLLEMVCIRCDLQNVCNFSPSPSPSLLILLSFSPSPTPSFSPSLSRHPPPIHSPFTFPFSFLFFFHYSSPFSVSSPNRASVACIGTMTHATLMSTLEWPTSDKKTGRLADGQVKTEETLV